MERENYLRVTQILYPFSGLKEIDPDVVAYAAERGTKVHKICEGIILGIGEIGVEEETRGYVESFKKWWQLGHEVVGMEKRFWDDELCVTGQVDLITNTPKGLAVVDLKTSSKPSKTWPIQGAAYAMLARNARLNIEKIYFVHLNKHGKEPKVIEYPVDDILFLSCWRVYNHFYNKEDHGRVKRQSDEQSAAEGREENSGLQVS